MSLRGGSLPSIGREVEADLDAQGAAVIKRLLTPAECRELSSLYAARRPVPQLAS